MLLKLGVTIEHLKRPARRALEIVDALWVASGEEAVITSTREGVHKASSLHYDDSAFDVRTPKKIKADDLRARLGLDYDVIVEKTHWHIEYDPVIQG